MGRTKGERREYDQKEDAAGDNAIASAEASSRLEDRHIFLAHS
jgi:hypothetical protein